MFILIKLCKVKNSKALTAVLQLTAMFLFVWLAAKMATLRTNGMIGKTREKRKTKECSLAVLAAGALI